MSKRQHHRGKKRPKSWHRGQGESRRWGRVALPDTGTHADPTAGTPIPLRRKGRQDRGDTF